MFSIRKPQERLNSVAYNSQQAAEVAAVEAAQLEAAEVAQFEPAEAVAAQVAEAA